MPSRATTPSRSPRRCPASRSRSRRSAASWVRVRTAYDYPGLVRADALGGEANGEWLVAREGDPVDEAREQLAPPMSGEG